MAANPPVRLRSTVPDVDEGAETVDLQFVDEIDRVERVGGELPK